MDYREYEDEEINLKDVFFYVLRHLKEVLIVGLIGLLAFGGYKGYKAYSDTKIANGLLGATSEDVQNNKAKLLNELTKKTTQLNSYMEEYNLFELNPYDAYVAKATYLIDFSYKASLDDDVDYTNTLLDAYRIKLLDENNLDELADKYDVKTILSDYVNVSYDNNLLYVSVYNDDQDVALNILHDLTSDINSISSELSNSVYSHSLSFVSETVNIDNGWVLSQQNTRITNITNTLKSIDTLKTSLSDLDSGASGGSLSKAFLASFSKYGLIGLLIGVVVACAYYFVLFILKNTVYSASELKDKTDIRVLGLIANANKSSKLISWINKMEYRPEVTDYSLLSANICAFSNNKNILLCGDVENKEDILANIKLKDKTIISSGSLLDDSSALEALNECDDVVLLIKCNKSNYDFIKEEKKRLVDLNKNLIGCVVVE